MITTHKRRQEKKREEKDHNPDLLSHIPMSVCLLMMYVATLHHAVRADATLEAPDQLLLVATVGSGDDRADREFLRTISEKDAAFLLVEELVVDLICVDLRSFV